MKYQALLNGAVKEITPEQADAMIEAETKVFGSSNLAIQTDDNGEEVATLIPYTCVRSTFISPF